MALSKILENSITDGVVSAAKLKDFAAAVDLNGVELILDADQDTSITADTDDRIDFKIAGVEHISISNSSGDTIIKPMVDAKDIVFQQYDGNKIFEINDANFVAVSGAAAGPGEIRIYEDTDNGTHYTGFKAGNNTASVAYVLPTADGTSGHQLTTDGSGTLSWSSAGTTLANDANNRVITGTGSGLNGEANLTFDGSTLAVTGAITGSSDLTLQDDLILDSDAAVLSFGEDNEITLTHVADTGLLLNGASVIQFRDSAINIGSPADGDLDINADDEIELNSTLIDINGNVEISGTAVTTGVHTFTAVPVFPNNTIETADIQADAVDGTKIADDAINSEHYTDGSIDTAHIADNQVTTDKLGDMTRGTLIFANASGATTTLAAGGANTVLTSDGTDIAYSTVGTDNLAADAITAAKIADNAVVTAGINADAVTGAKIADDAINSEHYTDGSIDTAHIADGQITTAKLATAVFTGATDIGAAIVDADLFLMDDGAGGTIRKSVMSRLKTYIGAEANTPSFYAYGTSQTTIGSDALTKIIVAGEQFDNGGCYNATANSATLNSLTAPAYAFTPNVAGLYFFTAMLHLNHDDYNVGLVNNLGGTGGTETYAALSYRFSDTANSTVMVSGFSVMNGSGNNICLTGYQASGGNIANYNSIYTTFFGGFLVKAS